MPELTITNSAGEIIERFHVTHVDPSPSGWVAFTEEIA